MLTLTDGGDAHVGLWRNEPGVRHHPFPERGVFVWLTRLYFRFSQKEEAQGRYFTAPLHVDLSRHLLFTALMVLFNGQIAALIHFKESRLFILPSPHFIIDWMRWPPSLCQTAAGRGTRKFAFIRIGGVVLNIIVTYSSYRFAAMLEKDPTVSSWLIYHRNFVVAISAGGGGAELFQLILLRKVLFRFKPVFIFSNGSSSCLSLPLTVAGFAGMINETFDRVMLNWWRRWPMPMKHGAGGHLWACYKLSILITCLCRPFAWAANPSFFGQSTGKMHRKHTPG